MSIRQKIVAGIASIAIVCSLAGCADTSWASKIDGNEINAGVYISYELEGYDNVISALNVKGVTENYFSQTIDEKDVKTYIKDYATEMCKRSVAINNKFDELGLAFSDEEEKTINKFVNETYDEFEDEFENYGISKQSFEYKTENEKKYELIFDAYYGVGGIEEVSSDVINETLENDYARVKILPFSLMGDDGEMLDDAGKKDIETEAKDYIERVEDGEDFNDMINAYYDEKYPGAEEQSETIEEDEYENENIISKDYQYLEPTVVTEIINNMKAGDVKLVKGGTYYYVVQKLDILEREDVLEENQPAILLNLKQDDFDEMIKTWYANYEVELNEDSYERYDPKDVIDRNE